MQQQVTPVSTSSPLQAFFFHDFANAHIPEILEEIYIKRVYQPFLLGKKDLIIADFGGNVGLTSFYFKDFAKQVFCVEPAKSHQEAIKQLIDYNKISNITLCPYAISHEDGTTKFYHNDNVTMFSLSDIVNKKDDYEEVETVRVDTFFQRNKIDHLDLLKLDVEGTEGQLVASEGFVKMAPKIKVIVGEYHDWTSCNKEFFLRMLQDLGYEVKWMHNTNASVFTAVRV